nr:hybrid non-ribosomal peptide synthetase/type I polyketide synthase [Caldimonas brevitalea]
MSSSASPDRHDTTGATTVVSLEPTAAQRRLWFVTGGDLRSATYNVPASFKLTGPLDTQALEQAIDFLVLRHPVLRSRFHTHDGQLRISLAPPSQLLRSLDLSHLPPEHRLAQAAEHGQQHATHVFDLEHERPIRALLLRLDEFEHQLLVNIHHMVFDDWSTTVFFSELGVAYDAFRAGTEPQLPAVRYETADVGAPLDPQQTIRLRDYWARQLEGAPTVHKIPTDRQRPAQRQQAGAVLKHTFGPSIAPGIAKLCRSTGVTPYMVGMAAFATLLHRYSLEDEIVIGSPFANRATEEQQRLIGFFINLIPLRFDFQGADSFLTLLQRVRETMLDAFENARLPFDEIVEVVRPPRSLSHTPIFQVMFDYLKGSPRKLQLQGLDVSGTLVHTGTAKYDLTLSLEDSGTELAGIFEYDTELFDHTTVARLASHFEQLLQTLLAAPQSPLTQGSLVPPAELTQLLQWAQPDEPLVSTGYLSIVERIRASVRRTPHAEAVVYGDHRLTYAELDRRANRVAAGLRARGVTQGQPVATLISYSHELIIAFVAVLKAGGVYLPLGPTDPRVPEKIDDAAPRLILTTTQDRAHLGDALAAQAVLLDELLGIDEGKDMPFDGPELREGDAAYVIYTSGSTGTPKGVEVSHGNLNLSYLAWCQAYRFDTPGRPVTLQLAGPTFDLFIGDVSRTLGCGGCLILCPRDWLLDAEKVHGLMTREKVTFGDFPPVVLRELIRYCSQTGQRLDGLDTLVCGADVWFGHELHAAQALCGPHARVLGSYGVTEATIDSSVFDPALHPLAPGDVVPIGRPLPSCELYVVDERLQLTPIGVPGELLIAGPAVSQRYLNNPALTADKFLSGSIDASGCVVRADGPTRFYRTGDLCRLLPDGTIEFMGRRDHQVKVRGLRVELGEIESALSAHPEVRQCAVIARNERFEETVLVAFAVTDAPVESLHRHLTERLAAHMVPGHIERLERLPLTPSGKIDRKRLKTFDLSAPQQPSRAAPGTDTERRLLTLWQSVLPAPVGGVDQNFFLCGGHSLLATRLIAKVNTAFGVELGVSALFNFPTVAQLAQRIDESAAAASQGAPVPTSVPAHADARWLSFAQQSLWLAAMKQRDDISYHIPVVWRLVGRLDRAALQQAIQDVVHHHPALGSVFSSSLQRLQDDTGAVSLEPVRAAHDATPVELRVVDLSTMPDADLSRRLREEQKIAFDLSRGPLVRAALFTLDDQQHVLCVTLHHIVVDGPSLPLFWADLQAAYQARLHGRTPTLAAAGARYADFVAWQREQLRRPAAQRQLAFWRDRLHALPAPLRLPETTPPSPTHAAAPASLSFPLAAEVVSGIERWSRQHGCTPYMFYCSLFALVLSQATGDTDVVIGTPISLRPSAAFDSVIGLFANTLPLRIRLDGLNRFEDLLLTTKQVCLDVYENAELPFERLVQELKPPRVQGRNPVYQVIFSCELDDTPPLQLEGLAAEPVPLDAYAAKLDLEFALNRSGGVVHAHLMSRAGGFGEAALAAMQQSFLALASAVSHNPALRLEALPRREDLAAQDTASSTPRDLYRLFAERLVDGGDRLALDAPDLKLRYRELEAAAAATAAALQGVGVRRGDRVGIYMGRHPHTVTAMLAINRLGAAFVPLDPDHTLEWNRHIVEDAALSALVCRDGLVASAERFGLPVVTARLADTAAAAPEPVARDLAGECAYVIYTSGSTGRPKGVAVSHESVCHNVLAMRDEMRLTNTSRMAQYVSPIFDVVLGEIFPALASGAAVVFGDRQRLLPGPGLIEWLASERITHWWIVPSALAMVPAAPLPDLQVLIVAGEACPPEVARRWAGGRRLLNGYGPTECAIVVSLTDYWAEGERLVLRPMGGAQLYVLDEAFREVPAGAAGELFLGGICVAQGYLGLPGRTAHTFIADPCSGNTGARLYRTGDVVRRLDDGSIQFIGRVDRQVKIRGFRVELDAVRAALLQLPGVRAAEALVQPDRQGQAQLVGYVVGSGTKAELLEALRRTVPEVMVPSALVFLDQLPTGSTGKVDLRALKALKPGAAPAVSPVEPVVVPPVALPSTTLQRLTRIWCELLERDEIGADENFFDAGGHSLRAVALHQRIGEVFGDLLSLTDVFEYPTLHTLSARLDALLRLNTPATPQNNVPAEAPATEIDPNAIAVIGMVGRFPSAPDLQTFWQRLMAGDEAGVDLTDAQLRARGVPAELIENPRFVRRVKVMDGVADFDAGFFGYSPREAQLMDPQQRLFLEMAWEVLEQAGYGDHGSPRSVGVFGSAAFSYYLLQNVMPNAQALHLEPGQWLIGNDKDFIATRTAYKLNLRGPALSVGTACSSSLSAVHLACASLRAGECEMALAGGMALDAEQAGYVHAEGGILSPDGRCRPFDAKARGTANGSGGGLVLLKPLSAALRDGDTVQAVIKGSAVNNDGAGKVSYTAPSVAGQAAVIQAALQAAGVSPQTIGYVEAHGTGTPLGDPIEVRALTQAFRDAAGEAALPAGSCGLGSVKGNIGHLDAAAGIAGLIKTILALQHETLPPSLNCEQPHPQIRFDETPFDVVRAARPWPRGTAPRRAGVSSFGVGGTNAHVVLEEAPRAVEDGANGTDEGWQLLPVSARSKAALGQQAARLAAHLAVSDSRLRDVAHTLQKGRSAFQHRTFAVGHSVAELATQLASIETLPVSESRSQVPLVFMFPGQGSQYVGMGRDLYTREGVFRREVDRCAELLRPSLGLDVRELMYGSPAEPADPQRLAQTRYTQPALFVVEYALSCQLEAWGIVPQAVIGHSLGELVAACVSGVITLDDALALVALRGATMQAQPAGAMLAVAASREELADLLRIGGELAAVNGPEQFVLAGAPSVVAALEDRCITAGIGCQRLATSHAFHSASMQGAAERVGRAGARLASRLPRIPMISNRSGGWFDERDRRDPAYWGDQLRQPVQFADGISTVLATFDDVVLLEIGPGRTLSSMLTGREGLERSRLLTTMRHAREQTSDEAVLLRSVGTLWARGVNVAWDGLQQPTPGRRVPLPTYPFERSRHWLDRPDGGYLHVAPEGTASLSFQREDSGGGVTTVSCVLDDRPWFIDEHRIFDGQGVLPGTACLELVRRAHATGPGVAGQTLCDVYFPSPLVFEPGARRRVRVVFTQRAGALEFALESATHETPTHWQLHANGQFTTTAATPAFGSPDAIRERFALQPVDDGPARLAQAFADYGPRWRSVSALWLGDGCGLAQLALPTAYTDDLPDFVLHPALLDLATSFLQAWLRPEDGAIPFHYERLTIHQPLRPQCYSLAIETAPRVYDVTVFAWDEQTQRSVVLVHIQGFGLRALRRDAPEVARGCRVVQWVASPLGAHTPAPAPWLLFADEGGDLPDLVAQAPQGSVVVRRSDGFRHFGERQFGLRPGHADDLRQLLTALEPHGGVPQHVVYTWAGAAAEGGGEVFETLITLLQVLARRRGPLRLSLLTRGLRAARTLAACHAATAVGLLKAVQWEFPDIACRHIDLEDTEAATQALLHAELSGWSASAAATGSVDPVSSVTLGQGKRETPQYVALPQPVESDRLVDGGVYLITGGLGGIGFELARHIATRRRGVKLALMSRTGLDGAAPTSPGRAVATDRDACVRLLEEAGAEVLVLQADVADAAQVADAVDRLRQRYGRVHGVVHAAGVEASGLIETGSPAAWRRVLGAKVDGIDHLRDLIEHDRPDFVVLCSSLASVVGGLGQADYAAANAYLDAVARHWRGQGLAAVSVNWDAWSETGMAVAYAARTAKQGATAVQGLTNRQGRLVFDLALGLTHPQLVVNAADFGGAAPRTPARQAKAARVPSSPPTGTDAEQVLTALWQELLGVEQIGLEDDFFELGGHSLLATQLISRVRDLYDRCLTLGEFLDQPTLARILRSLEADAATHQTDNAAVRYCVVPLSKAGTQAPFFCLPGMGGNITQLLPLATALKADRPVIGLQYLGLDGLHEPHTSVEQIAAHYVQCLHSVQPHGPYHFGGHSLGGKVAYEMARQLQSAGDTVGLLALVDSAAPPYSYVPHQDDAAIASVILGIFAYYSGKLEMMEGVDEAALRQLSRPQLLDFIGERLARFELVQAHSDNSSIRGLFNVYRAAADLSPKYNPPRVKLPIPMLLVKAVEPMPQGIHLPEIRDSHAWGWEHFTDLPIEIVEVPGNHYTCLMSEHVEQVATPLRLALAQATKGSSR